MDITIGIPAYNEEKNIGKIITSLKKITNQELKEIFEISGALSQVTTTENNETFYNRPNYYTLGVSKLLGRNYGFKVQASVTHVNGSMGINHDLDTDTPAIFEDEIIFRLITTISF